MYEIYVLFYTHFGAIDFEKKNKSLFKDLKLAPTPRVLSSSCGVCAIFTSDSCADMPPLKTEHVAEIYTKDKGKYVLLVGE